MRSSLLIAVGLVAGLALSPVVRAAGSSGTVTSSLTAPWKVAPTGKARVQALAHGKEAWVGKLVLDADAAVPEHQDPTEEFIVVLEGGGTITIDGVPHEVKAGSAVYMPADATVSYANGPSPMVAVQVFAGPEPASKYDAWK
jgi:quercetin dioxygenase-like cupin family protein